MSCVWCSWRKRGSQSVWSPSSVFLQSKCKAIRGSVCPFWIDVFEFSQRGAFLGHRNRGDPSRDQKWPVAVESNTQACTPPRLRAETENWLACENAWFRRWFRVVPCDGCCVSPRTSRGSTMVPCGSCARGLGAVQICISARAWFPPCTVAK